MTGQGEGGDLWVRRRAEKDRKRRQKLRKRLEAEGCSEALIERIIAQERLILSLLRRKSTITKYQYDRIRGGYGSTKGEGVSGCVFCDIIEGKAPATVVAEAYSTITIVPLNPVTEGHLLVIPRVHGAYLWELPGWNGGVLYDLGEQAREAYPCNIIQSNGAEATQTVLHVHFHIVPRREGDGLMLPWSDPQEGGE